MASKQVICTYTLCLDLLFLTMLATNPLQSSCLLVPHTPLHLDYHKGALLAGDEPIKLHLTFYGDFAPLEKNTIRSFLKSLSESQTTPSSYIAQASAHIAQASPHIHQASSYGLQKSARFSLRSFSKESELNLGRRGLPSSVKASGFSSFEPKTSGSSSSELEASGSSPSELDQNSGFSSFKLKASGFSSSELKASGSSPAELNQESGFSSVKQKARGFSSSELEASGSSSFNQLRASGSPPTVANWWALTQAYTDFRGNSVSQTLLIEHEASNNYSLGKFLSHSDIASLAKTSARAASHDQLSVHVILTAADVGVEGFCMHACGRHAHIEADGELGKLVYAWVGNSREQCPGYCSWPFARTQYGPDVDPLKAPNSASADGMIISLAKVLVEAATNPYGDGYQLGGDSHGAGIGAGGVCTGVYGEGAYSGYEGHTFEDALTGASFNVMGADQSKFLLPYIWNPLTLSCAVHL